MRNRREYAKKLRVLIVWVVLTVMLFSNITTALAVESKNLLLSKNSNLQTKETSDKFINILLLGVDVGGSGGKKKLEECHTDSVLVVSLNLAKKTVDLVSIPRDTLTYVPNVKGIYKLNAAFNCATSVEEGIQNSIHAVSWLLGGIKIDYYCLVDMKAMTALGHAIGGVDFDMDMAYKGSSGRKYRKGMQHLDGVGIMDYVRARKNATINANDLGRTGRNRRMIAAILKKLYGDMTLVSKALAVVDAGEHNIYTNIRREDVPSLSDTALTMDIQNIGSYVLTGNYRRALQGWNFTFTDQQHRIKVLKEVYGIDAEPIPYVSKKYTEWLDDAGFTYARYIFVAEKLLNHANSVSSATDEQKKLLGEFTLAYEETIRAFEDAADSMGGKNGRVMQEKGKKLRTLGDQLAKAFQYPDQYSWKGNKYWYRDSMINEYPDIKWY